jgi:hypothetical protein
MDMWQFGLTPVRLKSPHAQNYVSYRPAWFWTTHFLNQDEEQTLQIYFVAALVLTLSPV